MSAQGTRAVYTSPVNYGISQTPPGGIIDPVAAVAISQLYKAVLALIQEQTPYATGGNVRAVIASSAIAYGEPVNLYSNSGVLNAQPASSTPTVAPCHGFCTSLTGIASGSTGLVVRGALILSGLSGLTLGSNYWLAGAGAIATVADTAAGHIEQYLGVALSATELFVNASSWIQH